MAKADKLKKKGKKTEPPRDLFLSSGRVDFSSLLKGFPVDVIEDKNALDKMVRALLSEKPGEDSDS
jgi:hypothetical protein